MIVNAFCGHHILSFNSFDIKSSHYCMSYSKYDLDEFPSTQKDYHYQTKKNGYYEHMLATDGR